MLAKRLPLPLVVVLALVAVAALGPPTAAAKPDKARAHSFQGTVSAVARDRRSFRIRHGRRATVSIRVGPSARRAPRVGDTVKVRARRGRHGGWVATRIARVHEKAEDPSETEDDVSTDEDQPADDLGDEGDGSDVGDGFDAPDDAPDAS